MVTQKSTTPPDKGFAGEFAAWDDRFIPSLRKLAQAAKSGGAPAILQIFHAGNKATPGLIEDGDVVSASAVSAEPGPFNDADVACRPLDGTEIEAVIAAYGEATRRAIEAGFDGVELHGAHGFLLQNFLSPRFNERADDWGGPIQNRMRFPLAVVQEVQWTIHTHAKRPFLLGYRLSPEEYADGGLRSHDVLALVEELIRVNVDYLHLSLSDLLGSRPLGSSGNELTAQLFLERIGGRVPVVAAGKIRTPEQAERALALGLDLVAIGKGLVMNPDWVERARDGRAVETLLDPTNADALAIPYTLVGAILVTPGWFDLREQVR